MSSNPYSASQIKHLQAMDFNNEIVELGMPGVLDVLGFASYVAGEGLKDTPKYNDEVYKETIGRQAQLILGLTNKIIALEQDRITLSWGTFDFVGADLVNGVLPFSSIPGLSRPPLNAGQFLVFKGGSPLSSSDPYSRAIGTANLIPGTGIRFTDSWEDDQQGILMVFTGRLGEMIKTYSFYGSSFNGSVINLAAIGTDLNGNTINPLPTASSQVKLFDGLLRTEEGGSYITSGFGGASPTITLTYSPSPDAIFHFLILR